MITNLDEMDAYKPYRLLSARITRRDWFRVLGKLSQADNGCIIWIGGQTTGGYGVISMLRGRKKSAVRAPRLVYEICYDEDIPSTIEVCHKCDNPSCVNPSPLFLGTRKVNTEDKMRKGRWRGGCPKGYFAGGKNHKAKLNHEAIAFILDQKINRTRNTEKYEVTRETIYNVWKGKTWIQA